MKHTIEKNSIAVGVAVAAVAAVTTIPTSVTMTGTGTNEPRFYVFRQTFENKDVTFVDKKTLRSAAKEVMKVHGALLKKLAQ